MRIGMVADTYKPYISGVTIYLSTVMETLRKRGHEVILFTFDSTPAEPGVVASPGFRTKIGYAFGFRYSGAAKAKLREMDIVHIHHPFISGYLAVRALSGRVPAVFTAHTRYDIYTQGYFPRFLVKPASSFLHSYLRWFSRQVRRVITNSAASEQGMRNCGVDRGFVRVPNGISLERFRDNVLPEGGLRDGMPEGGCSFCYSGRLSIEKNLPLLLQAFANLHQEKPEARLLLVGDGPLRGELQEICESQGLGSAVRFLGKVDYARIPAILKDCDVFVMPSVTDTHPLALQEGMASGLAPLVSNSVAYEDLVLDGKTGLVREPQVAAFAEGMRLLMEQPDRVREYGRAAEEHIQGFSVERTVDRLESVYQEVIEESQVGQA